MVARKKSEEIQKAKAQRIQEKVHQILYCDTNSDEFEVYGQRFKKIVERSDLKVKKIEIEIEEELVKEYRKRVENKLKGKEPLDRVLTFYRILSALSDGSETKEALLLELECSEKCLGNNLLYLEKSGLVEQSANKFSLSSRGSKLLARAM